MSMQESISLKKGVRAFVALKSKFPSDDPSVPLLKFRDLPNGMPFQLERKTSEEPVTYGIKVGKTSALLVEYAHDVEYIQGGNSGGRALFDKQRLEKRTPVYPMSMEVNLSASEVMNGTTPEETMLEGNRDRPKKEKKKPKKDKK